MLMEFWVWNFQGWTLKRCSSIDNNCRVHHLKYIYEESEFSHIQQQQQQLGMVLCMWMKDFSGRKKTKGHMYLSIFSQYETVISFCEWMPDQHVEWTHWLDHGSFYWGNIWCDNYNLSHQYFIVSIMLFWPFCALQFIFFHLRKIILRLKALSFQCN